MMHASQIGNPSDGNSTNNAGFVTFECNICLEQANEPVVTRCGHLFCWSCLHQWLNTPRRSLVHGGLQPGTGSSLCPVCKSAVTQQNVTPIYARGGSADPRSSNPSLPLRPPGERLEPESPPPEMADAFAYGGTARAYSFSSGYGQFPVVCSMVFNGSGIFHIPMASRKARLVVIAVACVALFSMSMM